MKARTSLIRGYAVISQGEFLRLWKACFHATQVIIQRNWWSSLWRESLDLLKRGCICYHSQCIMVADIQARPCLKNQTGVIAQNQSNNQHCCWWFWQPTVRESPPFKIEIILIVCCIFTTDLAFRLPVWRWKTAVIWPLRTLLLLIYPCLG